MDASLFIVTKRLSLKFKSKLFFYNSQFLGNLHFKIFINIELRSYTNGIMRRILHTAISNNLIAF